MHACREYNLAVLASVSSVCCRRSLAVSGKYSPPVEAGRSDGWMSAKFVHKNPTTDELMMNEERSVDGPSTGVTSFTAVNDAAVEAAETEMKERQVPDGDSTKKLSSTEDSMDDLSKLQSADGIQI